MLSDSPPEAQKWNWATSLFPEGTQNKRGHKPKCHAVAWGSERPVSPPVSVFWLLPELNSSGSEPREDRHHQLLLIQLNPLVLQSSSGRVLGRAVDVLTLVCWFNTVTMATRLR